MKILIAANQKPLQQEIKQALEQCGVSGQMEAISDGYHALTRVTTNEYDVAIISDSLEGIKGLDILERLKDRSLKTKILFFNTIPNCEQSLKAFKSGAAGYISSYSTLPILKVVVQSLTGELN
jgi:DNA-binding NarL/FixJ family response regulator